MRALTMALWALFGWPWVALRAFRARRRLRGYLHDERGFLTIRRVA
jgi:hypothetical protein